MKCPKCGFVSYGLDQCKKCGYSLVESPAKGSSARVNSLVDDEFDPGFSALADHPLIPESGTGPAQSLQFDTKQMSAAAPLNAEGGTRNWREELSDRVVNFRKRRGIYQIETNPLENLELEFENFGRADQNDSPSHLPEPSATEDSAFDLDMKDSPADKQQTSLTFEEPAVHAFREELHFDTDPEEAEEEMSLGESAEKSPPMEILVNSPAAHATGDSEIVGHFYAPLGRRFWAGLMDAGILLAGAAIFGGIFWYSMTRFCEHNSLAPASLGILGLIAMIVIFAYFASFTALSSATPGMLWTGCEVRNLQGEHPTVNESLWRAFGVLVSMAALMVGFVWAYVDSETLTWHDRMSGTVITDAKAAPQRASLKVES